MRGSPTCASLFLGRCCTLAPPFLKRSDLWNGSGGKHHPQSSRTQEACSPWEPKLLHGSTHKPHSHCQKFLHTHYSPMFDTGRNAPMVTAKVEMAERAARVEMVERAGLAARVASVMVKAMDPIHMCLAHMLDWRCPANASRHFELHCCNLKAEC